MNKFASKIAIGTAQWGMNYGISNNKGQTSTSEAQNILITAKQVGITLIDTASLYGDAEVVLGKINTNSFSISSKTPHFQSEMITEDDVNLLIQSLDTTLKRLKRSSLYCLFIHNVEDLFALQGSLLIKALEELKDQNKFLKIGLSVYDSTQIERALELITPDVIQIPLSIFDQRLLLDGTIQKLYSLGIEIHARSIFLQGLMLMNIADIPAYFTPWLDHIKLWHSFCSDVKMLPQVAALQWACSIKEISNVIVGIQNVAQLEELVSFDHELLDRNYSFLARPEKEFVNPSLWRLQ